MQRTVVAAREENIHEANLRRERQNFVGPRHRTVHGNKAHVGEFIQQVQFLDGLTQRLTQSEIWLRVYLVGGASNKLLALQRTFALSWDTL